MSEGKRRYSLISVEVASEEEPTVRVDAHGAHVVSETPERGAAEVPTEVHEAVYGTAAQPSARVEGEAAASERSGARAQGVDGDARVQGGDAQDSAQSDSEGDELDPDDLDGSVPFVGMQRVIVVLLILALAAAVVYFVLA